MSSEKFPVRRDTAWRIEEKLPVFGMSTPGTIARAGSSIGGQCRLYPDGTAVQIVGVC